MSPAPSAAAVTATAAAEELHQCKACGASPAPFRCSGCRTVHFCKPSCQRELWPQHRAVCRRADGTAAVSAAATAAAAAPATRAPSDGDVGEPDLQPLAGEWVKLVGRDAFPGEDAGEPVREGVEAAQRLCAGRGHGGFVLWQGTAFLRARSATELAVNARPAPGTVLYLHAASLAADLLRRAPAASPAATFELPASLPEVVVDGAQPVAKLAGLSEAEMTKRFQRSQPVVLKDAQEGWPAKSKWTFEWLAEHFGDEEMMVSDLAPFFQHCDRGKIQTVKVSMREYVRYVLGKPNGVRGLQCSDERVFYGNGWAPFCEHDGLLADVSDRLYCVQDSIPRADEGKCKEFNRSLTKVFLGPAGTVSRLHHDTYATHVWLSQIRGRKQFIVYAPEDTEHLHGVLDDEADGRTSLFDPSAPDFEAFPRARQARAFSVVVEEGETVVLPSRWWHWAKSLTPSVTLMRNFVNEINFGEYMLCQERSKRARIAKEAKAKAQARH